MHEGPGWKVQRSHKSFYGVTHRPFYSDIFRPFYGDTLRHFYGDTFRKFYDDTFWPFHGDTFRPFYDDTIRLFYGDIFRLFYDGTFRPLFRGLQNSNNLRWILLIFETTAKYKKCDLFLYSAWTVLCYNHGGVRAIIVIESIKTDVGYNTRQIFQPWIHNKWKAMGTVNILHVYAHTVYRNSFLQVQSVWNPILKLPTIMVREITLLNFRARSTTVVKLMYGHVVWFCMRCWWEHSHLMMTTSGSCLRRWSVVCSISHILYHLTARIF